jgi:hypothetical protein
MALGGRWRVVELWTVPAEPVLATADPGLINKLHDGR